MIPSMTSSALDNEAAYAAVLQTQGVPFRVIGRSASSAATFQHSTGLLCMRVDWRLLLSMPVLRTQLLLWVLSTLTAHQLLAAGCQQ